MSAKIKNYLKAAGYPVTEGDEVSADELVIFRGHVAFEKGLDQWGVDKLIDAWNHDLDSGSESQAAVVTPPDNTTPPVTEPVVTPPAASGPVVTPPAPAAQEPTTPAEDTKPSDTTPEPEPKAEAPVDTSVKSETSAQKSSKKSKE